MEKKKEIVKKTIVAIDPEKWDIIVNVFKTFSIPVMESDKYIEVIKALRSREIIDIEIHEK